MDKTVTATLKLQIDGYLANLVRAKAGTAEFTKSLTGVGKSATLSTAELAKHGQAQAAVGHSALLMGAGIAAGLGLAVKAAIDWESAWAGVQVRVQGSKEQMAQLETGLRGLATTLPATHNEIAAVAATAGQLGVSRDSIVSFTKVMVDLGATTKLSATEAAIGIAMIMRVMQTPYAEVGRVGSTIAALGNLGASTEADILAMASRIAGAGKLIGASEADVLALSNALTSMGIQAELGGSSVSRIMVKIYSAVKDGGQKVKVFADVAGESAAKFSKDFGSRPIQAIDTLVHGLDRIDKSGGNVISSLREMGFTGVRDLQVLLKLKDSGNFLAQSLALGSKAWLENTALTERAAKRYETTASQLKVLGNQAVDVGIQFGGQLLPVIKGITGALSSTVTGFGQLPPAARTAGLGLGVVATAGLGLIGVVGTLAPKVTQTLAALRSMGSVGTLVANNLGTVATGVGLAVAAFAIYSYVMGQHAKAQAEARARADELTTAIQQQGTQIGKTTDEINLTKVVAGDVGVALRQNGTNLAVFTEAMNTSGAAGQKMRTDLRDLQLTLTRGQGVAGFINSIVGAKSPMESFIGQLETSKLRGTALGGTLLDLAKSHDISTGAMARLVARVREQNDALGQAQVNSQNQDAANASLTGSTGQTETATQKLADALKAQAAASANATKEIKQLNDEEKAAIDPLFNMIDKVQANKDAQEALNKAQAAAGTSGTTDTVVSAQKVAAATLAQSRALDAVHKAEASGKTSATTMAALNDRLAAAHDRLTKAQEGTTKATRGTAAATADLTDLQLKAAKSALDVDLAATELAGSIAAGTVSLTLAKAQLAQWVDNGLISKDTAAQMSVQFDKAAASANKVAGERVADLKAVDNASPVIDNVLDKLNRLQKATSFSYVVSIQHAPTSAFDAYALGNLPGGPLAPGAAKGQAAGGWAGTGTTLSGPSGTDTIRTYLTPGEFVVDAHVASRNAAALERLNRTGTLVGATAGARFSGTTPATMPSPQGSPSVIHVYPAPIEIRADDRYLKAWMRNWMKNEGGNVQKVLGPKGRL